MNTCYVVRSVGRGLWAACRSSRQAGLFSFGILDGLSVRPRRPYVREAPAGFGLERLATAFMNNPGFWVRESSCASIPTQSEIHTSDIPVDH